MKTVFETFVPYCTINSAYVNKAGGGRHRSKKYNLWIKDCKSLFRRNVREWKANGTVWQHNGWVNITYEISDKYKHGIAKKPRDLGNHEKMLTDLVVSLGIIADDKLVSEMNMRWSSKTGGVRITVERA